MDDRIPDVPIPIALGVMGKLSFSGLETARLSPPLSPEEAAALSRCFLADVAGIASELPIELRVRRFVVLTPSQSEDACAGLLASSLQVLPQRGDDLSERLINAVEDLLSSGCAGACLISGKSPTLPAATLERAITALRQPGDRVVIGPALDGGSYLIGVNRSVPELFRGITSSTAGCIPDVAATATALGLAVEYLAVWYDVDDGLALAALVQELLGNGKPPVANGLRGSPAPHTRAYLSALAARGDGPPRLVIVDPSG